MNSVDYPIVARDSALASGATGVLRRFRIGELSDVVEAIWDCDVPDGDLAKTLTIKCPPGTALWLMGQYRAPAEIRHGRSSLAVKCATQIQRHAVTLHPTGALGIIIVCLKPEAARRLVNAPLRDFADANIHLRDLFGARDVARCDEMLAGARTSEERITGIRSFLYSQIRPCDDSLATRAAMQLRNNPTTQVHLVAAALGVSARHLSRAFKNTFGVGPKRFARLARFQKILAERQNGGSWAQVASACGLTDQAHLIGEFQDIVGRSPTEFFTRTLQANAVGLSDGNLIIERTLPVIVR